MHDNVLSKIGTPLVRCIDTSLTHLWLAASLPLAAYKILA